MAKIAIVGAGYMGTATAWPLADNNHEIRLVGTHLDGEIIKSCKESHFHPRLGRKLPQGVVPYYVEEMAQALDGVDIIVSGVNSWGVHWIGETIGPYLKARQLIIAVTKGLETNEKGDIIILPDALAGELPAKIRDQVSLAAIGGPCIAGELAARRQTCVAFGSRSGDAVKRLASTFKTPYYHIWPTTDLQGLEICAALKNAYTLGVGLAAGILEKSGGTDEAGAFMHNLAAATFGQATREMEKMLEIQGATPSLAYSLPGCGDMYVTCMGGRTVRLGKLIGSGHTYREGRQIMAGETLESVAIIETMSKVLPKMRAKGIIGSGEFPLMRALIEIIAHENPAELPLHTFFQNIGI
jgi:glycerol-3-phosphate dehydrogenase (NAD(P)+)